MHQKGQVTRQNSLRARSSIGNFTPEINLLKKTIEKKRKKNKLKIKGKKKAKENTSQRKKIKGNEIKKEKKIYKTVKINKIKN